MKRPQSAVTETQARTSFTRPLSGISNQTANIDSMLSKANYSSQLGNVEDSLQMYEQCFKMAAHHMSSIRMLKMLEDVVNQLIKTIRKLDNYLTQQVVTKLLIWCQIQQSYEDYIFVKCPPLIQVKVLSAYGEYLRKVQKFEESYNYLNLALQMLSQYKHDQPIDDIVGQTYYQLSNTSLYQQNYADAIKEANAALQHLQQALINKQSNEETPLNMCDTYINLGIAKEHEKQFQEAHYNYYSALVFAQQNLKDNKIQDVQQIYDQFLSRQAAHLQKLTYQSQKTLKRLSVPQKKQQTTVQPFIEIVKNMSENNKLNEQFFKKKQRLLQSLEKSKSKNEIKKLQKFSPYLQHKSSTMRTTPQSKKIIFRPKSPKKLQDSQSQSGIQSSTKNRTLLYIKPKVTLEEDLRLPFTKIQHPAQVINFLQKLLSDNKSKPQQVQQFPNIHLPSLEQASGEQLIFQGTMTVYYFQNQGLLYFQYMAQEMVDQFTQNFKGSSQKLIGLSLNISDIVNQYNFTQDIVGLKEFLLQFSVQYFKYAKINQHKQSFHIPFASNNQFYFIIQNQNLLVQFKNDYEQLVFASDNNEDIQPILNEQRSKSVLSDDIRPLIAECSSPKLEDEIQPILGLQEQMNEQSVEYSQDFEPAPLINQKRESQASPEQVKYNGMEKFTIKIESEDQKSKEVIEVYADSKQLTEEQELEQAAKLIQKKFRLRNKK
ncbi:hypothetical protein pb186bvf_013127 [Paramecium bursaria]